MSASTAVTAPIVDPTTTTNPSSVAPAVEAIVKKTRGTKKGIQPETDIKKIAAQVMPGVKVSMAKESKTLFVSMLRVLSKRLFTIEHDLMANGRPTLTPEGCLTAARVLLRNPETSKPAEIYDNCNVAVNMAIKNYTNSRIKDGSLDANGKSTKPKKVKTPAVSTTIAPAVVTASA